MTLLRCQRRAFGLMVRTMSRTKWDKAALESAKINSADSEFMADIGLKGLDSNELAYAPQDLAAVVPGTDCHRIGAMTLGEVPLYVRESIAGVWTIDETQGRPVLVNSSARTFSLFVVLWQKYLCDFTQHVPQRYQERFLRVIQDSMKELDSAAFYSESHWSFFMEHLCDLHPHVDRE